MTDTWHGKRAPTGGKFYPAWSSDPTRHHLNTDLSYPAENTVCWVCWGVGVAAAVFVGVWVWKFF